MVWRICQASLILGFVLSCSLGVAMVAGIGMGTVAVVEAVMPKAPTAMIYVSSPDDSTWKSEFLLTAALRQNVILQPVPDNVRHVEVRYEIPAGGERPLVCDRNKPSGLGETFTRRTEPGADAKHLYQVVSVTLPLRKDSKELYAANVVMNFCGSDDPLYYPRTYYLGLWYGPLSRVAVAAAEKNGVTVDALRPH